MSVEREQLGQDLSAYLDGELPPERAAQIEAALKSDPALSAELESLRSVHNLLMQLPREKSPASLARDVTVKFNRRATLRARATEKPRPTFTNGQVFRLAAAAVLVLALGTGLRIHYLQNRDKSEDAPLVATGIDKAPPAPSNTDKDESSRKTWRDSDVRSPEPAAPAVAPAPESFGAKDAEKDSAVRHELAKADRPGKVGGVTYAKGTTDAKAKEVAEGEHVAVVNYFINTDNLVQTQRQMERVLARNNLKLQEQAQQAAPVAQQAPVQQARQQLATANSYNARKASQTQIQYEVVLDEKQFRKVLDDLNGVRAAQNVAQIELRTGGDADYVAPNAPPRSDFVQSKAQMQKSFPQAQPAEIANLPAKPSPAPDSGDGGQVARGLASKTGPAKLGKVSGDLAANQAQPASAPTGSTHQQLARSRDDGWRHVPGQSAAPAGPAPVATRSPATAAASQPAVAFSNGAGGGGSGQMAAANQQSPASVALPEANVATNIGAQQQAGGTMVTINGQAMRLEGVAPGSAVASQPGVPLGYRVGTLRQMVIVVNAVNTVNAESRP